MKVGILSAVLNSHSLEMWTVFTAAVMHVQFSSGVTIWQHVLKWVVNTSNVHGKYLKWCAQSRKNCFILNHWVFADNSVKLHYFCHSLDGLLYKVVCIHTWGEVCNFCATLLGIYLQCYVPDSIEICCQLLKLYWRNIWLTSLWMQCNLPTPHHITPGEGSWPPFPLSWWTVVSNW